MQEKRIDQRIKKRRISKVTDFTNYGEFIRDIDLMIMRNYFLINKLDLKKQGKPLRLVLFVKLSNKKQKHCIH